MSKVNQKRTAQKTIVLLLCLLLSIAASPAAGAAEVRAIPTDSAVILNGRQIVCSAYNIGGSNYFKLRDLMQALDIYIGYDGVSKTISITTTQGYVPDGSETSARIAALPQGMAYEFFPATANSSAVNVKVDDQPVEWAAYSIGGNNHFKLRDICETLDIDVKWDDSNNKVLLNTSGSYLADEPAVPAIPATPPIPIEEMKLEIVRLTNIERAKYGLQELQVLSPLMECAQAKMNDMLTNGYFGHDSPVYGTCFQMIRSFVPETKWCTENLAAWAISPERAIAGWLDSPGHRANLLDPRATHIGIGVSGSYWVQQFVQL